MSPDVTPMSPLAERKPPRQRCYLSKVAASGVQHLHVNPNGYGELHV